MATLKPYQTSGGGAAPRELTPAEQAELDRRKAMRVAWYAKMRAAGVLGLKFERCAVRDECGRRCTRPAPHVTMGGAYHSFALEIDMEGWLPDCAACGGKIARCGHALDNVRPPRPDAHPAPASAPLGCVDEGPRRACGCFYGGGAHLGCRLPPGTRLDEEATR